MPLSDQLKSEMTGVPAKPEQEKAPDKPVMEASDPSPLETESKENETGESVPLHPLDSDFGSSELLKSIEEQLKALNQNVLDLKKGLSENKGMDFRTVLEKIESARSGIEEFLAPGGARTTEEGAEVSQNIPEMLQTIIAKLEKNDRQLAQTLRENATFQIQVRQGMQQDLDNMREQLSGEQYNSLLKEIASVYVEYQNLLEDESISGLSRKNLQALFEQLEDILSDYGAEVSRSDIGSVRATRTCKIIGKIPTGDSGKHNTIAASKKPGVVRGRTVLYPEFVDVYVYDSTLSAEETTVDEKTEEAQAEESEPAVKAGQPEQAGDTTTGDTSAEGNETENNIGGEKQ